MKKVIFGAIALHLAIIVTVICVIGATSATVANEGGDKFTGELERNCVLHVLENDTAIKQGYMGKLLAAFNQAYAEYGITAVDANVDEYTDLAEDGPYGCGPDIIYQANDVVMKYVDGRHVLPLPVEELDCYSATSDAAWEAYTKKVDGIDFVFGVPVNTQGPLLFYREDMLPDNWQQEWDDDKDGICDILQYWTDMYRFSKMLKAENLTNSYGDKRYGYMRSFLEPYFSVGYLYSYGGYSFGSNNTDPKDIGHSANDAEKGGWIIRQLASQMDERCIDDSVTTSAYSALAKGEYFATMTTPDVYTLFYDELVLEYKRQGMTVEQARVKAGENLKVASIPLLPASGDLEDESQGFVESRMMGGISGYAISAYTSYPNACLAFINFATTYQMLRQRNELLGIVPTRTDLAEDLGGLSLIINNNLEEGNIKLMPSITEVAQLWKPLQTLFQDLAKDAFRSTDEVKYNTLEKIKEALRNVDKQIYDAIYTLS